MRHMGLLDDYYTSDEMEAEIRRGKKTLRRYEREPDGLPYVRIGNQKFYRKDAAKAWIARRERKPNPRRSYQASA